MFVGLLAGMAMAADKSRADVTVTIQPSGDGSQTYYNVSWDDLAGGLLLGVGSLPTNDPVSAARLSNVTMDRVYWEDVGGYVTGAINNDFYLDGASIVSSSPANYGVYVDYDGAGTDDFGILIRSPGAVSSSGSFLLVTATRAGGFGSAFNVGTFTNNANATITVSNTPFSPVAAIPEPTTLFGVAGLVSTFLFRRRRRLMDEIGAL